MFPGKGEKVYLIEINSEHSVSLNSKACPQQKLRLRLNHGTIECFSSLHVRGTSALQQGLQVKHLQASYSKESLKVKVKSLSRVRLLVTPWTVAHQAPLSMGFSRQEYWSGLPFHSPGDLSDPGIEPWSPALQANALTSEPSGKTPGSH